MKNKIRLLLVEDDTDFCTLIQNTLNTHSDLELIGICHNGPCAIEAAVSLHPDIVLMDLFLETDQMDGAEAAREIRLQTDAKVIILTVFDAPDIVISACRRSFASGYVFKHQSSLLIPTIYTTAEGPTPQSALIFASLLETLTIAERSVLERLLGSPIKLHSSEKTLANQQTSILKKMGLNNKQELIHIFSAY